MTTELSLAAEFAEVNATDWLEAVDAVLKGADFQRRLVTTLPGGLAIEPLYDRAHHSRPDGISAAELAGRGAHRQSAAWDLRQRHDMLDPEETNQAILADLEHGATSILLRVRRRPLLADLRRVLDAVHLDMATVALDAGPWAPDIADHLDAVWAERGVAVTDRRGSLRIDPLGTMARYGASMPSSLSAAAAHLDSPQVTTMAVDATVYSDGGANSSAQVGLALATGVEYLRWLTAAGMTADQAADQIEFTFPASADQFVTMAKLRAARRTWARVLEASGASNLTQRIHAITDPAMFTARDPWVNLLRSTTAAFAAAAGGADSITVLPFDSAIGVPAELGRRTARNISHLLAHESHIAAVVDPGGGSWFIETLTDEIAEAAWHEFQRIESQGGMNAALVAGVVQDSIAQQWHARKHDLATRKAPLTGVSEFPDLDEEAVTRDPWPRLERYELNPEMAVIPFRRLAQDFEVLRDAAGAGPNRSAVFMAALGPPSVHGPRVAFATNFFAAGGIRAETRSDDPSDSSDPGDSVGFEDPGDIAQAYQLCGTPLAVICSSDAKYAELGEEVAATLKAAGCDRVYLAGNPGDARAGYERAGVDEFIHLGCDVLAVLEDAHSVLGTRALGTGRKIDAAGGRR